MIKINEGIRDYQFDEIMKKSLKKIPWRIDNDNWYTLRDGDEFSSAINVFAVYSKSKSMARVVFAINKTKITTVKPGDFKEIENKFKSFLIRYKINKEIKHTYYSTGVVYEFNSLDDLRDLDIFERLLLLAPLFIKEMSKKEPSGRRKRV